MRPFFRWTSNSSHPTAAGLRGEAFTGLCSSLALVATVGIAALSALALGQPGGLEAQAALALVNVVAGV
jgi:hypothetical protein